MKPANGDIQEALDYHGRTKHSMASVYSSSHYLDFDNQPIPFKIYSTLDPIPLPDPATAPQMSTLDAICASAVAMESENVPDVNALASILRFSAGITKRKIHPRGEMLFRAAACTGALYHIDLYLVCGDLPGLEAGVYHFGPQDFALRRLRAGDYRDVLVRATAGMESIRDAPAVIVCTDTFWRNSWKYQSREYRHAFWDCGTILANLLAVCAANRLSARIVCGFIDDLVNRLLDLNTVGEVSLALVPIGKRASSAPTPAPKVQSLGLKTVPLSNTEVDYPLIRRIHNASCLHSEEDVTKWGNPPPKSPMSSARPLSNMQHGTFRLNPLDASLQTGESLGSVILRRGSTRQFSRVSIILGQLSNLLSIAGRDVPADFLDPSEPSLNALYLIVNAVEGLPAGAYVFHRDKSDLDLLRDGVDRQMAGHLGLGQDIPADASADAYVLSDLDAVLRRFGNRGYRAAQLEAGVIGGRLYLAAYAMGIGASGLTFFDDDVTAFFSPHAERKSVMFLTALGKSV